MPNRNDTASLTRVMSTVISTPDIHAVLRFAFDTCRSTSIAGSYAEHRDELYELVFNFAIIFYDAEPYFPSDRSR